MKNILADKIALSILIVLGCFLFAACSSSVGGDDTAQDTEVRLVGTEETPTVDATMPTSALQSTPSSRNAPIVDELDAILSVTASPTPSSMRELLQNNGVIAFVSNRDGNDDIFIMNADGTNQINLTNSNKIDSFPSWSPDGTQIAFHSTRTGHGDIYVMNADGSGLRRLTDNPSRDTNPIWLEDGNYIMFASHRDTNSGRATFYMISSDGTGETLIGPYPLPEADYKRYSPTTGVAYVNRAEADGQALEFLGSEPWSPDGNFIVFFAKRDGNESIYVRRSTGTEEVRLTNNQYARDMWPVWSPVAMSVSDLRGFHEPRFDLIDPSDLPDTPLSTASGTATPETVSEIPSLERMLYIAEPRMTGDDVIAVQQRLFDLGYTQVGEVDGIFGPLTKQAVQAFQERSGLEEDGIVGPVTWENLFGDSSIVAAATPYPTTSVHGIDPSSLHEEEGRTSVNSDEGTTDAGASDEAELVSLDGEIIYAVANGLHKVEIENRFDRLLVGTPQMDVEDPIVWSPRGDKIAMWMYSGGWDGKGDIYIANADGTQLRKVTEAETWFSQLTWSPDGSQLAYCAYDNGFTEVTILQLDTLATLSIARGRDLERCDVDWSPVGDELAVSFLNAGIFIVSTTGPFVELDPENVITPGYGVSWSPDGEELAFTLPEDEVGFVHTVYKDGTNRNKLTNAVPGGAPDWSPNGDKIVFAGYDQKIYVVDKQGVVEFVTTFSLIGGSPKWSPDGTRIAFVSSEFGNSEIYVVNADGSGRTQVTNTPGWNVFMGDWAPEE